MICVEKESSTINQNSVGVQQLNSNSQSIINLLSEPEAEKPKLHINRRIGFIL